MNPHWRAEWPHPGDAHPCEVTAHSGGFSQANEERPSIGDPSIAVEIVLGANQAVEVVKSAQQSENGNGDNDDDKRSHLTSSSSAAPSEGAGGYRWNYFNHGKGRKQAG